MYVGVRSLCCAPEANVVLCVGCPTIKNNHLEKKIVDI